MSPTETRKLTSSFLDVSFQWYRILGGAPPFRSLAVGRKGLISSRLTDCHRGARCE